MFNSLFNSLFGKSSDNNSNNLDENQNLSGAEARNFEEIGSNVTAILLDEDVDWLFVEKEGEVDTTTSIERTPRNLQLVPFKSILSHLGSINENDENNFLTANLPALYPNSMDDSWFLTPPECFSSVSSIQLESSPLENLLIEHPSMSVYYNFHRRAANALAHGDAIEDLVVIELPQHDVDEEPFDKVQNKNRDKRNNKKSRSSGATPKNVALILVKKTTNNNAQKSQDQRKASSSKSAFERNNKCYALRHAPKRTTVINQPTSRTMMMIKKN